MIVRFVDIGRIDDHHCLISLTIPAITSEPVYCDIHYLLWHLRKVLLNIIKDRFFTSWTVLGVIFRVSFLNFLECLKCYRYRLVLSFLECLGVISIDSCSGMSGVL